MQSRKNITRFTVVMALVVLAVGILAGAALAADPGVLVRPDWTASNTQTSAASVSYTYLFTTATTGTISKVTMTVPAGTAGTPAVGTVYGIGAGSVALADNTLTYTVTEPASVAAATPIYIQITGMTNSSAAGNPTAVITTWQNTGTVEEPVWVEIDENTTPALAFGGSTTAVNVAVAQTLLFTNDTALFNLGVDPTNTKDQQKVVSLSVKTNAQHGYTLSVSDTSNGLINDDNTTIARVTGTGTDTFPAVGFGFQVAKTAGTGSVSVTSANWYGFKVAAGLTQIYSNSGPTGNTADALTMTNKVAVDFTQAAGIYTDVITYTATPSY